MTIEVRFGAVMGAGFVLGVLLGTAGVSGAVSLRWWTAAQALIHGSDAQAGYVAGVYDATESARETAQIMLNASPDDVGALILHDSLDRDVACMNAHSGAGGTLGEFREWAVGLWTKTTNDNLSAAQVMLLEGCPAGRPAAPARTP